MARHRSIWAWVVPLALVSALILVGAIVLRARSQASAPQPTPVVRNDTKEAAAVAFLTAVSEGRASDALAMSATEQNGPFLTDEALRASLDKAPISDIGVEGVDGDVVRLKHRVGEEETVTSLAMEPKGEQWQVERAAAEVLVAPQPEMVPVMVDGVKAEAPGYEYRVLLLPGQHQVSTGSQWLEFPNGTFTVTDLSEPEPVDATVAVADETEAGVRRVVEERLRSCAQRNELAPEGCPWNYTAPDDQPIDPESVQTSLVGDPVKDFEGPTLNEHDALATGRVSFTLQITATITVEGNPQPFDQQMEVESGYTTDLLTEAPDFTWSE